MLLASEDLITWDFWLIQDDRKRHHAFFLQAPRSRANPESRHNMASVGHAVSTDLTHWQYRGTAIERGEQGSWHDLANWTGSVARTAVGDYVMLITGRSTQDAGTVQRIGVYYSQALYAWTAHPRNPVITCDTALYHAYARAEGDTAWRDPWLYWDDQESKLYAFITAQKTSANGKAGAITGCLAVAVLTDAHTWALLPPLDTPTYFSLMECPVIRKVANQYYLFVSLDKRCIDQQAPPNVERKTGTHLLVSEALLGPYRYVACVLDGGIDVAGEHRWAQYQFVPTAIDPVKGEIQGVNWLGYRADDSFQGGLSAPRCVSINHLETGVDVSSGLS